MTNGGSLSENSIQAGGTAKLDVNGDLTGKGNTDGSRNIEAPKIDIDTTLTNPDGSVKTNEDGSPAAGNITGQAGNTDGSGNALTTTTAEINATGNDINICNNNSTNDQI